MFHIDCFACQFCHKKLEQMQIYSRDRKVACLECVSAQLAGSPQPTQKKDKLLRSPSRDGPGSEPKVPPGLLRSPSRDGPGSEPKVPAEKPLPLPPVEPVKRSSFDALDINQVNVDALKQPDFSRITSSAVPDLKKATHVFPLLDTRDFVLGEQVRSVTHRTGRYGKLRENLQGQLAAIIRACGRESTLHRKRLPANRIRARNCGADQCPPPDLGKGSAPLTFSALVPARQKLSVGLLWSGFPMEIYSSTSRSGMQSSRES
jgi:hypothetical protein